MPDPWRPRSVTAAYRDLLKGIAQQAESIGSSRLTSHWPLVGNAPDRLMVVGQAVFGWIPDWTVDDLSTPAGIAKVLEETWQVCYDRADPMNWIEESRARSSPFWRMVRHTVESLWPQSAWSWYSHVAWTNLYPIAPNDEKGNPSGALLEVQTAPSARLLKVVADALDPAGVLILGGPYWWRFQHYVPLRVLAPKERPLLADGEVDGRRYLAGMHPAGAQRRGWKAGDYARLVTARLLEPTEPIR